jgi:hypothetical protein
MAIKMKIPTRFIRVDNSAKTVATRGKGGRFTGRKTVRGKGDTTHALRLIKDVDLNKDNKPDYFGGTIIGRTTSIRASRRSKGYERRL